MIPSRSASCSAASATRRERRSPRRCTAPPPGRRRISRCGAPSPALRPARRPLGVPHRRRTLAAGHRQLRGHPRQPHRQPRRRRSRLSSSPARRSAVADAANRPTPSASAASPIRASAPASGSDTGQRRSPGRPTRGPGRASRADAGTTHGCCAPATPAGRRAAVGRRRPGRPWRCRSGPDRLRRRRAATVRAAWTPAAAASVWGRHRTAAFASTMLIGSRRYQGAAQNPVPAGTHRCMAKSTLVNSSWWPC